jgi:ferredoxin
MKGSVQINAEECKGCGLCAASCPLKLLKLTDRMNQYGYHTAVYAGQGCSGCGVCYYACPEPGGITVLH